MNFLVISFLWISITRKYHKMHKLIEPAILYFGTPVVLISSLNEDGSTNIAPMSSAWWLGQSCMLGMGYGSKTSQNIIRTKECVLNLPSIEEIDAVNKLALTTGCNPVDPWKKTNGYRYEPNKFGASGLTPVPSISIDTPRILECPVQMEAILSTYSSENKNNNDGKSRLPTLEVSITKVHCKESILMADHENRIDPDKWKPLIMSFCQFYGLGQMIKPSRLAEISEEAYRPPESKV